MNKPQPANTVWIWLAAGFLLVQCTAYFFAKPWLDSLGSEPRNPALRRGWLEYVEATPQKKPREYRILVLSHSQGYGVEVESRRTYPSRLATLLGQNDTPVRVVNWSVFAGQYFDFLILAAAAKDIGADMTVLVFSTSTLSTTHPDTHASLKTTWSSDTRYLLSRPPIRDRLSEEELRRCDARDIQFDIMLGGFWPAWRWRSWPLVHLARLPVLRPLFPAEQEPTWFAFRIKQPSGAPLPVTPELNLRATQRLLELASAASPKVIVVNMPRPAIMRSQPDPAARVLKNEVESLGLRFLPLEASIPDSEFASLTHLTPAGHRRLAGLLLPEVMP